MSFPGASETREAGIYTDDRGYGIPGLHQVVHPGMTVSMTRDLANLPVRNPVDLGKLLRAQRPADRLDVLLDLLDAG